MGSPAVRLLKADTAGGGEPGRAFALSGRPGWRTRIYASPEREAIVRALQGVASKKLAIHLAGGVLHAGGRDMGVTVCGLTTL